MYNKIILEQISYCNKFIRYNVECHKRFDLFLLDIDYSSDEMVKPDLRKQVCLSVLNIGYSGMVKTRF